MAVKAKQWRSAAITYSNLSELELTLGAMAVATSDAEQSVTYADRNGELGWRIAFRTTHADVLHQAGRRLEAETRFREAEQMQANHITARPLLDSIPGFRFCDHILAAPERAAWQITLDPSFMADPSLTDACHAAYQRAERTLRSYEQNTGISILEIALDHLTLGRAALYKTILEHSDLLPPISDFSHIDAARSGLHRAAQAIMLPPALLTRAWMRFLAGACTGPESTTTDLDDAWELAERGPMPLFQADVHLYRARLFHAVIPYPWESPRADLAAARRLIEKHGYWRRKEELDDAEKIVRNE